jgi:hypothetical protein
VPLAGLANVRTRAPLSKWLALGGLALMCGVYAWAIFAAKNRHLHLNDGTFSFSAPFPLTFRNSMGRLLWIWGAVSLMALAAMRQWQRWRGALALGAVWMAVTLLPYIFLTYMPRVPSRHTYLASAGLAVIVAAGVISVTEALGARMRRPALAAWLVAAMVTGTEAGYLWMAKRPQILARAEPTEALVRFAGGHEGPIYLRCFPTSYLVAESALRIVLHRPAGSVIVDAARAGDAPAFCHAEEKR